MSRRCKGVLYIVLGIVGLFFLGIVIKLLFFSGIFIPQISLKGDSHMICEANTSFDDPGVTARFRFQDYQDEVEVQSDLDTSKIGEYRIVYTFSKYNKTVERIVEVQDHMAPELTLIGNETMRVFENGKFEDPGVEAMDAYDGDVKDKVEIESTVDMSTQGQYTITYRACDASGNVASITRNVEVCIDPTNTKLYYNYDSYDNKMEEWWFEKSKDHKRMSAAMEEGKLNSYGGYYLGPDEKVLYLTFDEGGNDITYIKEIADVLNTYNIKATFFLTRNYIRDHADFINDLVNHGHVIGNHTWHHYDMTTLANAQGVDNFVQEISETEKTYMEVTGQEMIKVFRFPKGGASERAMKMVQDLGYTNYNWSHAYYDYASDVSKDEALKTMMDHYHNGAIYLLHPSNKGNYEAMEPFVKNMIEEGYTFDTVDNIPKNIEGK